MRPQGPRFMLRFITLLTLFCLSLVAAFAQVPLWLRADPVNQIVGIFHDSSSSLYIVDQNGVLKRNGQGQLSWTVPLTNVQQVVQDAQFNLYVINNFTFIT